MAAAFFGMLMTGTLLLSGMGMQASAQTIRHEHSGDAQNGGECFSNPVYHAQKVAAATALRFIMYIPGMR